MNGITKIIFKYNWCEYFTPCPHYNDIMVGGYDCSECQFCGGINLSNIDNIPEDYEKYIKVYIGEVNCLKKLK